MKCLVALVAEPCQVTRVGARSRLRAVATDGYNYMLKQCVSQTDDIVKSLDVDDSSIILVIDLLINAIAVRLA